MARRFLPTLRGRPPTRVETSAIDGELERKIVLADYFAALSAAGIYSNGRARPWPVERAVAEAYERIVWIMKSVDAIAGHASRLPFQVKKGEKALDDHPLYAVLNGQANPMETGQQFRKRLSQQILLSKRGAFVEVTKARNGDIIRMDLLPPGRTCPVPGTGQELIQHFEVVRQDGSKRKIDTEYVRWFRDPHPLDPYSGVTPLEAAGLSVELDFFSRLYNVNFLKNDARPGGVLAINGEMEETAMDRIERKFDKGPGAAGKLSVINGEVSYIDLAARPREMQYSTTSTTAKIELLAAFGVPESILGYSADRTFSNAEQEEYNFWTVTMPPHLAMLAAGFGPDSDEAVESTFDISGVEVLHKAEIARREEARQEFTLGLISADEYRDLAGYDAIDDAKARALFIASTGKAIVPANEKDAEELAASASQDAQGGGPGAPGGPPTPGGPEGTPPPAGGGEGDSGAQGGGLAPSENGGPPPPAEGLVTAEAGRPVLRVVPNIETKQDNEIVYETDPKAQESLEMALSAALTALVARLLERTVSRVGSPKARKGTRHWQPSYAVDTRRGNKAINASGAVDERRWQAEAETAVQPILKAAAATVGTNLASGLALSLPPAVMTEAAADPVQEVAEMVGEAFGKLAGQVTALVRSADQTGKPMEEIITSVRAMGPSLARWAALIGAQAATAGVAEIQNAIVKAAITEDPSRGITRQWRSRRDDRVRPTHRVADGQIRPLGEPFEVGGHQLRFPGDPKGEPSETWGCRCNLNWRSKASGRYAPKPAPEAVRLATRRKRRKTAASQKALVFRVERKAVSHHVPGTPFKYRHGWQPLSEASGPGNRRFAVRPDDARRQQGQVRSNFVHPVTGHSMGQTEVGDTYEALFEQHGAPLLTGKYGDPPYMAIARAGGTGTRTTALDFRVDHRGGELKSLSISTPNQKTAITREEVARKEAAVAAAKLDPLLVVQVVDQKGMSVKVYGFEAFASKAVSRMEYLGEYSYTLDDFEAAQRKTGHHEKREARAAAQAS